MALIKKYNRGGSFTDYVKNKAAKGELPLTSKSWTAVQEGLSSFNVDTPASGNVKKNWAGQYVADTKESVDGLLASLYEEYQQNAPKQVSITPEGGWGPADRTVGDLMSHIAKTKYHGNEDYAVQEIGKMTNNNDIKRYLVNEMNNLFTDYETHASSDTTGDNWKDLNKIRELKNIFSNIDTSTDISDDDWAKVGSYLQNSGFDWNLNDYLITDDEFKRREEQATANEAKEKRDASLSSFENLGISNPELRESLYNAGYTKIADNFKPYLSEYFKNNGYNVVSDESGKNYRVLKGNDLVNGVSGLMSEDQFSNDYGKTFSIQNGQIIFHDKGQLPEGLELPEWEDEGNLRRRLVPLSGTALPNLYDYHNSEWKGWRIFGDSNEKAGVPAKDILGRRDYTASITLVSPDNQQTIKAFKEADGSYITEDGRKLPKFTFSGFGESEEILPLHSQSLYNSTDYDHLGWGNIEANNPNDWWEWAFRRDNKGQAYKIDINHLEEELRKYESEITSADSENRKVQNVKPERVKTLLKRAKWYYNHGTKEEREWATANFNRLNDILTKEDKQGNRLFTFKQGGILKAQDGSSLKAAVEANKKYAKPSNSETGSTSEDKKGITGIDLQTAWKNASGLQKASTISSALSVIPVLGVAGGATSTVLDAIDGAQDGWDRKDTMNLIGNLGFTALAGIGLGGAKAGKLLGTAGRAVKTAKGVGKMADSTADIAKLVNKADKALDVTKQARKAGKLVDTTNDAAKSARRVFSKANRAQKILQGADNAEDLAKAKKSAESILKGISTKDLEIVENLSKVKTTWTGQHTEGIVEGAKAAGRFLRDKAPVVGKVAKIGLVGQTAISGASGAADLVGNIAQSDGNIFQKIGRGFGDTDIDNIRRVAQLGALSRIGYLNRRNSNAFLRNTEEIVGKDAVNAIKVGNKTYNLNNSFKGKNSTWSSLFRRVDNSKLSKGQLNTLEKELKASLKDSDVKVIMDTIKKEGIGAVKNVSTAAEDVRRVLKEGPGIGFKNVREYNRTKEMIERGSVQRGSFKHINNISTEKSYTPKDINVEKAAIVKANAKAIATAKAKASTKARANAKALKKASSDLGKRGSTARAASNKELDLQKLFKENKTVREAVKKFYGENVKVENLGRKVRPSQFNKKGEKGGLYQVLRDLNMPKNKQGGVLKMEKGKTFPSLYAENPILPRFDLSNLRFTSPYSTGQTGLDYSNPDIQQTNQAFSDKYPNISKSLQSFGHIFIPPSSSSSSSDIPDGAIDEFEVELFKKKPYRNYSLLTELFKKEKSEQTNAESTAEQIKAASQVPYMSTIQAPHLRTSTPFTALYEKEAGKLQSTGKRIADTTADWDKAAGVRLDAAQRAFDIRSQGHKYDIERNDAIVSQQNQLNNRMLEYNTKIANENAARGADARSKIHQLAANEKYIKGMGEQNWWSFVGKEASQAPMKKALHDLYQESANPNITSAYDHAEYLNNEGQKVFKDRWQASEDARKGQPYYTPVKWEDSDEYKEWGKRRSSHQNTINDLLANYQRAQRVASTIFFQGGGKMTLEDRIALENVKYNHKRLLKDEELYFKQLMNNSKLVQKALIKVFK